jgi:hypothetical protein
LDNLRVNETRFVVPFQAAVANASNQMRLRLPQPKEIRVRAHTIAEIEAEFIPIKYLKADAEGHEEKVISTPSKPVPLISLEFNFRKCMTLSRDASDESRH